MMLKIKKNASKIHVTEITKIALITSLYIVITTFLSVISFGAFQLRLSEMFNFLPLFHKRYIWAVTLGVAIANFNSPLGITDVLVGSISTFIVLKIIQQVTKNIENMKLKFIITAIIFSFSMFTVAGMLCVFYDLPFFYTWLTVGIGELFSMTIGGILIYNLHQRIDLTH